MLSRGTRSPSIPLKKAKEGEKKAPETRATEKKTETKDSKPADTAKPAAKEKKKSA